MTNVSGPVSDVLFAAVRDEWTFTGFMRTAGGGVIIDTPRTVRPVGGNLSVTLAPGPVAIHVAGHALTALVPESDCTLAELIEAAIAFPPNTPQELLAGAVGQYVEAHREQFRTHPVPITSGLNAGKYQWVDEAGIPTGEPVELADIIPEAIAQLATAAAAPSAVTADVEARQPQVIADPDNPTTHIRVKLGDATGPPMPGSATTWPLVHDKPEFLAAGDTATQARLSIAAATKTEIYYAKDHGVTADGTTNDLAALNDLITAVSASGGGVVLLPIGTVKVNGSISMKSNVTLRGHGWKSIIKLGSNLNGYGVIGISGSVNNIVIEDLKIDGDRATWNLESTGIRGMTPGGYSDVLIRNVWVESANYAGIIMLGDPTRATATKNVRIVDCKVTNVGGSAILVLNGVDQCWIERCTVIGHSMVYPNCPGIVQGRFAYDTHMLNNFVDSAGATGVEPHAISIDTPSGRFSCSHNTVVNAVGFGIEIAFATSGSVTDNHITGGAKFGIMLTSAESLARSSNLGVTIANNVIDGAVGGIGFYMGNPSSNQDCPPSRTILRNTAYPAATSVRVVEGRRIYQCTTSGTTHATVKPAAWGATTTGDTIADGTSVWTDRGAINAQITLTSNVICNVIGGPGILLTHCALVAVTNNIITNCGYSGIYVHPTANMLTIVGNEVQGNNTALAVGHSNVQIVAYPSVAHVVKIAGNRVLNSLAGGEVVAIDSVSAARLDNRIPAGTTQPTVAFGDSFYTQNVAATTITGFVDPNDSRGGRTIFIRVADANTTFQHSASGGNTLRLNGGSNYAAPLGTIMQFVWRPDLNQWAEVSRNAIG